MGHVRSTTRSLDQFLEKQCVHSRRHGFDPILVKLCQNVQLYEIEARVKNQVIKSFLNERPQAKCPPTCEIW